MANYCSFNHFGQGIKKFQVTRNGKLTKAIQLAKLIECCPGLSRREYLELLKPKTYAKLYAGRPLNESRGYYSTTYGPILSRGWIKYSKETGYQKGDNFWQIADL